MLAKEILIKTLEMIETKGWVKGIGNELTGYCLLHTIRMVSFNHLHVFTQEEVLSKNFPDVSEYIKSLNIVFDEIAKETDWFKTNSFKHWDEWAISAWNDEQSRTKEDVIRILKQSINSCE